MIINDPILAAAVQRIVDRFRPLRIYLFGSRAWGQPRRDSDDDLLVIVEDGQDELHLAAEMQLALRGLPAPCDIVVRTRSWWAAWNDTPLSLEAPIASDGGVLHDAA